MDRILIAVACTLSLNGCALYTVASVGTWAVTGRNLTDHGVSGITQHDCNMTQPLKGEFYCEKKVVYNQTGF
jgi:hypothetical protein